MAISALSSPMHQVLPNQKIAAQWRSYSGLSALKVMGDRVSGGGQLGVTEWGGPEVQGKPNQSLPCWQDDWLLQPLQADIVS